MEEVKMPAWKRTLIGLLLGFALGLSTYILVGIPLLGLLFVFMQTPAYLIMDAVPVFEFSHLPFLVLLFWGIMGTILGYLSAYKKISFIAIILIVILVAGTTLQFVKDFTETMSHF